MSDDFSQFQKQANHQSDRLTRVLHITPQLTKGGAGRALIGVAKYSTRHGNFHHECVSVKALVDGVVTEGVNEGLKVYSGPSLTEIRALIEKSDIVHWHYWQDFPLMREDLPRRPRIVWCAVSGEYPPNELPLEVVEFADMMVICNPMTRDLPAIRSIPESERQQKVRVIFESADFERILPVPKIPHDTFNVGWIGTVNKGKYNSRYIEMCRKIAIPNVRFMVVGQGPLVKPSIELAKKYGVAERFEFTGYQNDMKKIFGMFDVYGYPLDEITFAGGELNLQEAMVAGLPIVVFPYGGPKRMILHNYNGLIAYSENEYREFIEFLYHHPEERIRLGNNAKEYALREYGAENAALKFNRLYREMLIEFPQWLPEPVVIPKFESNLNCNLSQSVPSLTRAENPGSDRVSENMHSFKRLALYHNKRGNREKVVEYAHRYLVINPDDKEMVRLLGDYPESVPVQTLRS